MSADGTTKIDKSIDNAKEAGQRMVEQGYETAKHYADEGLDYAAEIGDSLSGFIKREPLIAVAGAFVIGYAIAQILRRTL
jgi:hypothetical protein